MAERTRVIEVDDAPDLLRVAEEVQREGESRILRHNGEDLAVISPLPEAKTRGRRTKTKADLESFRRAAGGWADVDTDRLIVNIYEDRRERAASPLSHETYASAVDSGSHRQCEIVEDSAIIRSLHI